MTRRMVLLKLFVLALLAPAALAQGPVAPMLAFDAVSIKLNKSGGNIVTYTTPERFHAADVPLKTLLRDAYDLQTPEQVIGLPGWTDSVRFDIEAKVDADTFAFLKTKSSVESGRLLNGMMQAALVERFHLKVHPEVRALPIFELTIAKGGSKLKSADPAGAENGNMNANTGSLEATGIPIANLCNFLSRRLHRQVLDKTGLTGLYDVVMAWAADGPAGEAADGSQSPSLFTALQEQLGLKLESTKGPVDTIVVEHVEMPSGN